MHGVHPHVRAVMEETGESDPTRAVRAKAQQVVRQYVEMFHEEPPFNLEAMASLRGLKITQEAPKHSPDSEIAPENGGVVLRVNRNRPIVRQRFSIGHEIGHTLFPEYDLVVRCRKRSDRDWADDSDQVESLCDVAASEILFPSPWFDDAVAGLNVGALALCDLALRFQASPEATLRRFADVYRGPVAVLFCSWKLKPTEARRRAADRNQMAMFCNSLPAPTQKLRVDYAVLNEAFASRCTDHVPKDKSLPLDGPIGGAALRQTPFDGALWIDLGTTARNFAIHAIPIFTPEDRLGPDGAVSVALTLRPTESVQS
jgi:Zn-dependent peptidase ImmA (M78 family)